MGRLFCVDVVGQSHIDLGIMFLQVDIASGMAIEQMCYAQVYNYCLFVHTWGQGKPYAV